MGDAAGDSEVVPEEEAFPRISTGTAMTGKGTATMRAGRVAGG